MGVNRAETAIENNEKSNWKPDEESWRVEDISAGVKVQLGKREVGVVFRGSDCEGDERDEYILVSRNRAIFMPIVLTRQQMADYLNKNNFRLVAD